MSVSDSLIAYLFAATLLTLTPGLDTALVLRTAAAEGTKKAIQVALGINIGCFVWATVVAFGLGALIAVSELAYTILKYLGAAYLCWLGIQLLMHPRQAFHTGQQIEPNKRNWFIRGILGNVLNPKVGIFYVSFLPQFIPVGHSPVVWTYLLVAIHVALGSCWSLVLITMTQRMSGFLKKGSVVKWMDRGTGGLFLLFAAKLALSKR